MYSHFSSLPDEVLKLVLQHVPLKDRLSSCCFVSKRLHAAAVAATQQLSFDRRVYGPKTQPTQAKRAWQWLSHYGQHVTQLAMNRFEQPLLHLPCPNRSELSLGHACSVQLGPTANGQP